MPKRYTSAEAIRIVKSKGFSPISEYPGAKVRWKCLHDKCRNTVFITLNSVQNARKKVGTCSKCATNSPTTEADAIKIMKKAGLKPLVKFPGYDEPWKSLHTKCGSTVRPRLHSIKAGGNGCKKTLLLRFFTESPIQRR